MSRVQSLVCWSLMAMMMLSSQPGAAEGGPPIRVAICQVFCIDGDRSGNLVRMENALAEANEQGAQLACFPESALLGWVNPDAHHLAHPIPGTDSNQLCELAKKFGMHLCAGVSEKDGDDLYDAAILISDAGAILLKHRKINNLDGDRLIEPPYRSGAGVDAVETALGKIGVLICADTFREDILQTMADHQPDLVVVPYGWVAPGESWPEHGQSLVEVVRHAAESIGAPVIGTDSIGQVTHGPWSGRTYGGFSTAADAEGRTLAVARDRDRDVLVIPVPVGRRAPP